MPSHISSYYFVLNAPRAMSCHTVLPHIPSYYFVPQIPHALSYYFKYFRVLAVGSMSFHAAYSVMRLQHAESSNSSRSMLC